MILVRVVGGWITAQLCPFKNFLVSILSPPDSNSEEGFRRLSLDPTT